MSTNHRDTIAAQDAGSDLTKQAFARVHQLHVVDLISEGPIVGLVEGAKSVYLNDDPIDDTGSNYTDTIIPGDDVDNTPIPTVTFDGDLTVTTSIVDDRIQPAPTGVILGTNTITIVKNNNFGGTITGIQKVPTGTNVITGATIYKLRLTKTGADFPADVTNMFPFTVPNTETPSYMGQLHGDKSGAFLGFITFDNINGTSIDASGFGLTESAVDAFISLAGSVQNETFTISAFQWVSIASGFGTNTLTLSSDYANVTPGTYEYGTLGNSNSQPSDIVENGGLGKLPGVAVEFRTGELDQLPLTSYGGAASGAPISIGNGSGFQAKPLEFKDDDSDTTTAPADPAEFLGTASAGFNLTPAQASAVDEIDLTFSYNSLYVIDETNGDKFDAVAQYAVTLQLIRNNVRTNVEIYSADDPMSHSHKTQTPVTRLLTINLTPFKPFDDFNVKVERLTRFDGLGLHPIEDVTINPDGETITVVTGTEDAGEDGKMHATSSITRLVSRIYTPLSYPLTALAQVAFTSKNFPNTPTRTYECFGRKVKIPSNYTPRGLYGGAAASYTGLWDGTFRAFPAYTDNPAWIFYDILTNNRYGLGDWVTEEDVDIFSLYRVAKYCDELVPDGKGGQEPRYRANIYLTKATDAYKVLKDMATTFLGLIYWMNGKVTTIADQSKDPIYVFNKTNVINGEFVYEGTGSKTRANQIVVSWNNPRSNYRIEPLIVEDSENIANTGKIISEEAMAFGCTSEGQATRYGRWKLWTSVNQTELVKFSTSIDAAFLVPGDVITLQDNDRHGTTLGGRIARFQPETGLTLDSTHNLHPSLINTSTGFTTTNVAQNVVMSGDAVLPRTFSQDECLFEFSTSNEGMWLGVQLINGVYNLVYRAGGQSAFSNADTIVLSKPIAEIPEFDSQSHTIVWEAKISGELKLWIDGMLYLQGKTTGGAALSNSRWAPIALTSGSWGKGLLGAVGGASINAWSGTIGASNSLKIYNNETTATNKLYLDRNVKISSGKSYDVTALLPQAQDASQEGVERPMKTETKALSSSFLSGLTYVAGVAQVSNLVIDGSWTEVPKSSSVFVLTEKLANDDIIEGSGKEYKIMTIAEQEQGQFTIIASEYYDKKYTDVESEEGFTVVRDNTLYPAVGDYDLVPPVSDVQAIATPNVQNAGFSADVSWVKPLNADGSAYNLTAAFEIYHSIRNMVNPIVVGPDESTFKIENIPYGSYQIRVQTLNNVQNRSMPRVCALDVRPQEAAGNIIRDLNGVGVGGRITKPLSLDDNNLVSEAGTVIFSAANPQTPVFGPFTGFDTENVNVPIGESSILLDADTKTFKCVKPFVDDGLSYFVDQLTGTSITNRFTQVVPGTVSQNTTGTIITGSSNTVFKSFLKVGDMVRMGVDGTTLAQNASGLMRVTEVIDDTHIRVDRFPTGLSSYSGRTLFKQALSIDNSKDTIVGRLIKHPTGAGSSVLTGNGLQVSVGHPFTVSLNQPVDLRIVLDFNVNGISITNFTGTDAELLSAMPHTLTLGLEYAAADSNEFVTIPTYNKFETYTAVDHPATPSSSQFQRTSTLQSDGKRDAAITTNLGAVSSTHPHIGGQSAEEGKSIFLIRDVSLQPGEYKFRYTTTLTRTNTADTVPGNSSGAHNDFIATQHEIQAHRFSFTTFGTTNTAPLSKATTADGSRLTHVSTTAPNSFTTEMTVDRTEVDILQATDELAYHWQFNDIAGQYITESIEGQDGEAES